MAKRRRIPWWVVMVAFATATGTTIGGLAYLRRPESPEQYCLTRTPSLALVREGAKHPLVEFGSAYAKGGCSIRYRPRAAHDAPIELEVFSHRERPWSTRVVDVQARSDVHAVAFRGPHASGWYIQDSMNAKFVLVMSGAEGETIEIYADPRVFSSTTAIAIANELGARI